MPSVPLPLTPTPHPLPGFLEPMPLDNSQYRAITTTTAVISKQAVIVTSGALWRKLLRRVPKKPEREREGEKIEINREG